VVTDPYTQKNFVKEKPLNIAITYANLAQFYMSRKLYKKAETYCIKSIEIRKDILGDNHLITAYSYNI